MPDMTPPFVLAVGADQQRRPRRRRVRDWLTIALIISLLVHVFLLGGAVLWPRLFGLVRSPPPPREQPGFDVVWDRGIQSPHAVPHPGKFLSIPKGENSGQASPKSPPPKPEKSEQQAKPSPEVNLLPPEYALPPSPPAPQAEASAEPKPHPRPRQKPRTVQPLSHPQRWSFAPQSAPSARRGLRGSRSLDLAMGPLIEGGQLKEAIPHIASPGADGDYMELLNEYVETHKFYPEEAVSNREEGDSVIRVTIDRDGTVRDVKLEESSGSRSLDLAWMSLFRDQHLPPFPDDMKEPSRTFTMSMTYEILYR